MPIEDNKAVTRSVFEEVFSKGDVAAIDKYYATDYIENFPAPGLPLGLEGVKKYVLVLRSAFPDFKYTVEDTIAEGDKVMARVTARGTHRGEFFGISPTGRQVTWAEIHIDRFANGKLVEHWALMDHLRILQQFHAVSILRQAI